MNKRINIKNYNRISVVGMGKVGLPISICYALKGFKVIGMDIDRHRIDLLNKGVIPLHEPFLPQLFKKIKNKITFTADIDYAVNNSSVIFIIVPTPSQKNGSFSLKYILDVCNGIGEILKKKNTWILINIISTLLPESMDKFIKPTLEKASGKIVGKDFGLCYSPEFVALGDVINNIFNPDFILIGESDRKSGKLLSSIKKQVCENNPPLHRTNFINAELAKIGSNTFITTKISFANMIARLCEKIPGADIDVVTNILKDNSSIGSGRLVGSISYGGPCFPRDNLALVYYANKIGSTADIAKYTHDYNIKQNRYLSDLVTRYINKKSVVGILGLAYKPDTDIIEESPGMKLSLALVSKNIPVIVYDPLALYNVRNLLGNKVKYAVSSSDCISRSDIIVITCPCKEFYKIKPSIWYMKKNPRTVIDCWRILNLKNQKDLQYIRLGTGILR